MRASAGSSDAVVHEGEGPSSLELPTRKRQGTQAHHGGKRQCVTHVANEEKPSWVAKGRAEGQPCQSGHAEEPDQIFTELRKGEADGTEAHEKHGACLLLDVFAGTAGVAAAFIQLGGEALGLDHVVDKKRVRGPVSRVDLCKAESQAQVLKWLDDGKIDCVMLAPPCGTSSRAREIPVYKSGRKRNAPRPLRSQSFPNGLPNLRGLDQIKVRLANKLYKFARKVIDKCIDLQVPFICENPQRSWMWDTSFFADLPKECRFQCIHSCMYGSARLKKTAFLMNFDAPNLLQTCDGKHVHLPWGQTISPQSGQSVFSTSVETEYPWKLCKQLALAFALQLQKHGKFFETQKMSMDVNQRMGAGVQPRGKLSPLMVSEFKHKVVVKSSGVSVPKVIEDSAPAPFQGVPIHSKLISSRTELVKKGDKGENEIQVSEFGVYRSPEEFIQFVSRLQHPLDSPQLLEASNMRAMLAIRDWEQAEILTFRHRVCAGIPTWRFSSSMMSVS